MDVACEEMGWVSGRVISFSNLDVTKVAEHGSSVSARTLDSVALAEEGSDSNKKTTKISKVPINIIYINFHIVNSLKDSEMIT